MRNFSTKAAQEIVMLFMSNMEKYGTARRATDDYDSAGTWHGG
jgi:hypothetical protein